MKRATHSLIIGMTESGKTTLAKMLARMFSASGISLIILDPMHDPEWPESTESSQVFKTDDPDEFLKVFWRSEKCAVFIDEAGESVGRYDKLMQKTATKGRHHGHRVHYITQRLSQISPNVRTNCNMLFLFGSSRDDCKIVAKEFNCDEAMSVPNFRAGEYLQIARFAPAQKGNILKEYYGADYVE